MLRRLFLVIITALLFSATVSNAQFRPDVPWGDDATFVYDHLISDEFNGNRLDISKWDPHGKRNPDTGCPGWNGPPSSSQPEWSTFFATTTQPGTGGAAEKFYEVKSGKLVLRTDSKPLEYFQQREYYCNATTFKCNHNDQIECHATDYNGTPFYKDAEKTIFAGITHDKCKIEPYCIPHPEFVTGKPRVYSRLVGAHITSKRSFKYGFYEVEVQMSDSPAVAAVWMHDNSMVNGFCRFVTNTDPNSDRDRQLECPSAIRSRRWQEIDMLEAMNSIIHEQLYVPNIHAFAGYKGEFTSEISVDNGDGEMGGGPILVKQSLFNEKNPSFNDLAASERLANDWHFSSGSVHSLDAPWKSRRRRLGLYWSPKEIRFYVDGEEVLRVRNTLIHQPMLFDLSYSFNVQWAQQTPTDSQVQERFEIMYVRRWDVYTPDGSDPPSSLPFNEKMTQFQNYYGEQLLGMFERFPTNDDNTFQEVLPEEDSLLQLRDALRSARGTQPFQFNFASQPFSRREIAVRMGEQDYVVSESVVNQTRYVVRQGRQGSRAGGVGNRRFSKARERLSEVQRRIALSYSTRFSAVTNGRAELLEDGETTVFEFANPQKNGAGWATADGLGTDGSVS